MFALTLIATLATTAPSPSPGPVQIYQSALRHLRELQQPAYIDMAAHWKVLAQTPQGDQPAVFDERVLFDSAARRECVLFVPYSLQGRVIIGQSYFAPDVWLMRHPIERKAQGTQTDFAPDLSDFKTIASVVSVAKPSYDIKLAGTDTITNGGGSAYHLVLKPLSDPWKHNLRELWVNTANFNIMRAVLVGDYRPDPQSLLEQTTVAEDFGPIGPYWVVVHHAWTWRDAPNATTFAYDVTAATMSFPSAIPAWYFDEAQFNKHRAEVNVTGQWP